VQYGIVTIDKRTAMIECDGVPAIAVLEIVTR